MSTIVDKDSGFTTVGCLRPRSSSWMFSWTVQIPLHDTPRRSNTFSLKGHGVYLTFCKQNFYLESDIYYVELHAPAIFPECSTSDITVQVTTKNNVTVRLPNNHGIKKGDRRFWNYSKDEILAAYRDFFQDDFLTFLVYDVDPPIPKAEKCIDQVKPPVFRTLPSSNDIPDGYVDNLKNIERTSIDIDNMLTTKETSDDQNCKGTTRPVPRPILPARSEEVFSGMFLDKMAEWASGIVEVDDLTNVAALYYVYFGKLPNIPEDKMHELYAASDKYAAAVQGLKKLCSDGMAKNLSADNFTTFLATADVHSDSELKSVLIESITDHPEWLSSSNAKWFQFKKKNPALTIEVYEKLYDKKYDQ